MYFNVFYNFSIKKHQQKKMILHFCGDQTLNLAGLPVLLFHAIL